MKVPVVADVREDMEIECHFDMGVEELYAIKWYKDEKEFFRWGFFIFLYFRVSRWSRLINDSETVFSWPDREKKYNIYRPLGRLDSSSM